MPVTPALGEVDPLQTPCYSRSEATVKLPSQPPIPFSVEIERNPGQERLRALALEHTPYCFETSHGSICKVARNKARMAKFTYVIDRQGDASRFSHNTIEPQKAQALIDAQAKYVEDAGKLIGIEAYVGVGPRAVPVQWLYTIEGANIAGMQQVLSFPRGDVESEEQQAKDFEPAFRLVYTPNFAPDMPGGQAIIVDLDNYRTYIMGADYFGESKKGALRMLAEFVHKNGGLLMHAGAKEVRLDNRNLTMGILGLSGTGKTTTTFSKQGKSTHPVQDDMIAIWPGGEISVTENGCFAKTWGLREDTEPVIFRGTCDKRAWIENVYCDDAGTPIFDKKEVTPQDAKRLREILVGTGAPEANIDQYISGEVKLAEVVDNGIPKDGWDFVMWSENGRSILPMASVEDAADLFNLPKLALLGILNRDEGADAATPGVVRFASPEQAAGYLMLGETSKTSAAGKDRGKTRSPFTQPFFPLAHSLQAKRFSQLAATFPETPMWLMNTGYVAGDKQNGGLKVKIPHSSAMLEALVENRIKWTRDPDFGYDVVDLEAPENAALVEIVGKAILQPKTHFEAEGKLAEYDAWVSRMKSERKAFLEKYDVDSAIVDAVVG